MRSRIKYLHFLWIIVLVLGILTGCKTIAPTPQDIVAAPQPTGTAAIPTAVPDSSDGRTEMQQYVDSQYGFQLAMPIDWTYKLLDKNLPGMPDDWPVVSTALFFPESLKDELNRDGPPDPNAPSVVPPFNIEVFVGPDDQFRRVYPEPGILETMQVNGKEIVVEKDNYDDFNTIRYVFSHPFDDTIKVVIVDVITGFSERVDANPEYSEVILNAVTTFEFTGESTLEPDPLEYLSIAIQETGITFVVPVSWERIGDEWIWEPAGDQDQYVGVRWIDLQPPQEPEAALLPQPSQILNTEEIHLSGIAGRTFVLEVYDTASEGGSTKAEIQSVEKHAIVVVDFDGGRRAVDFFASASSLDQLNIVAPVYTQLLDSANFAGVQLVNPLDTIRLTVAEKLNQDPNTIDLVLQTTEFPDACLGKPAEDEMCAQVLTPGYVGQLKVGDKVYEIRASEDAKLILVCDESLCLD